MNARAMVHLHRVVCCRCKTEFGMADNLHALALQRREAFTFYCPNGHGQTFVSGETEEAKLRRERDRLRQEQAWYSDELKRQKALREAAERSASARKGQITKMKKRAAAGVCPCCNRSFSNLRQHMSNQHPGFAAEEIA